MGRVGYWRGSPPPASGPRGHDRRSGRADGGPGGPPLRALRRLRLLSARACRCRSTTPARCPARCRCGSSGSRSRIQPARGAVFVLAGGPGQSATAAFSGDGAGLLYAAHRSRDAIVFDQRGTGLSGALRCRSLEEANLLDATTAAARCAAALGPRRGFYTSADTVEDMEAIRRELGVERDRDLRHVLRHQGRSRLRAALPGSSGAAGARLGGGGRRPRPAVPRHLRRRAAGAAGALPHRPAGRSRAIRLPTCAGSWSA